MTEFKATDRQKLSVDTLKVSRNNEAPRIGTFSKGRGAYIYIDGFAYQGVVVAPEYIDDVIRALKEVKADYDLIDNPPKRSAADVLKEAGRGTAFVDNEDDSVARLVISGTEYVTPYGGEYNIDSIFGSRPADEITILNPKEDK